MDVIKSYPRAILGWRVFRRSRGKLLSLGDEGRHPYSAGVNIARCRREAYGGVGTKDHPAPAPDCGCGIYAFHSIDDARFKRYELISCGRSSIAMRARTHLLAAVCGSGLTFIHDLGWRAERLSVICLELDPRVGVELTREGLDPEWGSVPIVSPDRIVAFAERHASSISYQELD